jgi:uncharacterized membrane protein YeaQ/YmgE (transglycosylase-associated protein family)
MAPHDRIALAGFRAHASRPAVTLGGLLVLLVVAGICGSIGRALAGYSHVGCLGSIALGFIGAALGMWISRVLHLPHLMLFRIGNESFPVLWSIAGSALFVAVLNFLTRRRD